MCQFVSWIEDEGNVLFLTTTDLKTKRGKAVWSRIKDDITGHGAIREYYSKDGISMEGGINRECSNFSKPENFPVEIQRALVNGAFIGMIQIPKGILSDALYKKYSVVRAPLDRKYYANGTCLYKKYRADIAPLYKKYYADKATLDKKYNTDREILYEKYNANAAPLDKKYYADIVALDKKYYAKEARLYKKCYADIAPLNKKYNSYRAALYKKYYADIVALSEKYWLLLKEPKNRSKAWREV